MKERSAKLMELAEEMLLDARLLLAEGRRRSSVNRAYYAAFNAASAVLEELGSRPKTHAGVLSEFGQRVVNSKLSGKRTASLLRGLFELRQECDYDEYYKVGDECAKEAVEDASDFLAESWGVLKKLEKR